MTCQVGAMSACIAVSDWAVGSIAAVAVTYEAGWEQLEIHLSL